VNIRRRLNCRRTLGGDGRKEEMEAIDIFKGRFAVLAEMVHRIFIFGGVGRGIPHQAQGMLEGGGGGGWGAI